MGTTKITKNNKIIKFSALEMHKLWKQLKLIQENIRLYFIVHTLNILIKLAYINHFLTLLIHI